MNALRKSRLITLGLSVILAQWALALPALAVTKSVNVQNISFSPSTVSLTVGDSVRWVWISGMHSTTSGTCSGGTCTGNGTWNSPIQSSGDFAFTFNTPGTFHYFCRV